MKLELENTYCSEIFLEMQYKSFREQFWKIHDLHRLYTLTDALLAHKDNRDNTGSRFKEDNEKVLQKGTGKYITIHNILEMEVFIITELLDFRELNTNVLLAN